jgi:hypothetical protein
MYEVQQQRPEATFLICGRGLTSRVRAGPGVEIGERVGDAVGAIDALVKRAALN